MPVIRLDFSGVPDLTPERASFLAHSHWLRAFATLAGFNRVPMRTTPRVLRDLATQAAAFPVPNAEPGNYAEALACLNRAWGRSS